MSFPNENTSLLKIILAWVASLVMFVTYLLYDDRDYAILALIATLYAELQIIKGHAQSLILPQERGDSVMSKLCFWDAIFGIYPPERAYRPDDEVGAIDSEGQWICDRCKRKYEKARAEAEKHLKGTNHG